MPLFCIGIGLFVYNFRKHFSDLKNVSSISSGLTPETAYFEADLEAEIQETYRRAKID